MYIYIYICIHIYIYIYIRIAPVCMISVPRVGWPGRPFLMGNAVNLSKGWARWDIYIYIYIYLDTNLVMRAGSGCLAPAPPVRLAGQLYIKPHTKIQDNTV